MANEIKIFKSEEFGEVRTMEINGEPYFVGKDVAKILGYADLGTALLDHVEDNDRQTLKYKAFGVLFPSLWEKKNDFSNKIIINESGVYDLIFSSKLPTAKKFKRWVTSEVLPSIRKTGGYVNNDELFIATYLPYADENTKSLFRMNLATIREQNKRIEEMKPKENYYDNLVDKNVLTNFRDTAKELKVGERKLIKWLEGNGYVYRDAKNKLRPYADVAKKGLFIIKEYATNNFGGVQTLITPKGREFLLSKIDDIERLII